MPLPYGRPHKFRELAEKSEAPAPAPAPAPVIDWDSAERAAFAAGRRVRVSFDCPVDVATIFRKAVRAVAEHLGGAPEVVTCVRWMLVHLAETHVSPEHEVRWRAHEILERGAWRCSMPHCRETASLHVHHIWHRSRGGPLAPWNEMPLCEACHLMLVHARMVDTEGTAPDDVLVTLGLDEPGGPREMWRDERLISKAPRLTTQWVPKAA